VGDELLYGEPHAFWWDPRVYLQKVKPIDMEDSLASKLRHLVSVRSLKRREAAHIKRLEELGGMGWHAQSDDLILCVSVEMADPLSA
jgi:hypothetical protein